MFLCVSREEKLLARQDPLQHLWTNPKQCGNQQQGYHLPLEMTICQSLSLHRQGMKRKRQAANKKRMAANQKRMVKGSPP